MAPLALDLDAVLADTRPLWRDWVEDASRRARVELDLPDDREAAAALLDEQLGDWRPLLARFAADRAPVYFRTARRDGRAAAPPSGRRHPVGAFTDAPRELADIALSHVGAARRIVRSARWTRC